MHRDRLIASARALLDCPFDVIADMLYLEPVSDWYNWIDPEGNRLKILKNNRVKVNLPKIKTNKTRDIFRKARPELIKKYSYWGMLLIDKNKNILILLGNDGKLRSSYFENNIWIENISPLLLGFDIIKYVASGYLDSMVRSVKLVEITYPKDFGIEEAFAFGIPIENNKLKEKIACLLKTRNSME